MANLSESAVWESNIYQLATDDPVLGGTNGIANLQPKQLANRTQWLKTELTELGADIGDIGGDVTALTARVLALESAQRYLQIQCAKPPEVLSVSRPGLLVVPPALNGWRIVSVTAAVGFPRVGGSGALKIRVLRFRGMPTTGHDVLTTTLDIASSVQIATSTSIDSAYDDLATHDGLAVEIHELWSGGTLGTGLTVNINLEPPV